MNETKEDEFTRLLKNLESGELTHNHIQIAYRAAIRKSKDIPEGARNLLGGTDDSTPGLLSLMFRIISQTIGSMELAYRRGYQAGQESIQKKDAE